MADIVYRDTNDKLKIGDDSDSVKLSQSVYRSTATKKIIRRDGMFVEVDLDGSGSRNLCATN